MKAIVGLRRSARHFAFLEQRMPTTRDSAFLYMIENIPKRTRKEASWDGGLSRRLGQCETFDRDPGNATYEGALDTMSEFSYTQPHPFKALQLNAESKGDLFEAILGWDFRGTYNANFGPGRRDIENLIAWVEHVWSFDRPGEVFHNVRSGRNFSSLVVKLSNLADRIDQQRKVKILRQLHQCPVIAVTWDKILSFLE
jgi:hypothetical protein